jgi:hypothetical protein
MLWRRAAPPAGGAAAVLAGATGERRMRTLAAGRTALLPAQPVLAWADGATAAQRLQELAKQVPAVPAAALPAALPEWFPRP